MNGCRTRKRNVVHANVFSLVNTIQEEKIRPKKSSLGKENNEEEEEEKKKK